MCPPWTHPQSSFAYAPQNQIAAQRRETEFLCLNVGEALPPAGHGGLFPPAICQFIATPTAAYWYCMQALHLRRALLAEHGAHPAGSRRRAAMRHIARHLSRAAGASSWRHRTKAAQHPYHEEDYDDIRPNQKPQGISVPRLLILPLYAFRGGHQGTSVDIFSASTILSCFLRTCLLQ